MKEKKGMPSGGNNGGKQGGANSKSASGGKQGGGKQGGANSKSQGGMNGKSQGGGKQGNANSKATSSSSKPSGGNNSAKQGGGEKSLGGNKASKGGRAFSGGKGQGSKNRGRGGRPANGGAPVEGTVSGNGKGYAFLVPTTGGEDYFIPAQRLGTAMHGDTVSARVFKGNGHKSGEAEVIKVLSFGSETVVGVYTKAKDSAAGFVAPDDLHYSKDIYIKSNNSNGAAEGDKVVASIFADTRGPRPEGKVLEVLGKDGDPLTDILSVIRSYDLYEAFGRAVLTEAEHSPEAVRPEELKNRRDFRADSVITIDGADSRDFDDAVYAERTADGFRLFVHIADVSNYVKEGSALDKEALKRGTSVYFPTCVLPMLPQKLSNGICSLNEGEDRLVLSCIMDFDAKGGLIKSELCEGVIRSKHRMTYDEVSAILEDDDIALKARYADILPMLELMRDLSKRLFAKRDARGSIEFDITESKIEADEKGNVINVDRYERKYSHRIIEEFMLAANEAVAERFEALKAPFVYRVHLSPPAEKVETLTDYLSALGITFRARAEKPIPKDFSDMLKGLKPEYKTAVNRVALRSMTKASYEKSCEGHFGLAAPFYCHFTSPIRRYPDLMIHRIIKAYMAEGKGAFARFTDKVEHISRLSSDRERLAESAEREVDDLLKAQFMRDKIGKEFTGVISGVTDWGIFIELENTVEGLVKTVDLPGDGYVYDAKLMLIKNASHIFRIGDTADIVVDRVNGDRVGFMLKDSKGGA